MALTQMVEGFRNAHQSGTPFVVANPWDRGSARILKKLGFPALATASSGFALAMGHHDDGVTRESVLEHCRDIRRDITSVVSIPVTADLENGFGPHPEDAAQTIALASQTDLVGGSIEDSTGDNAAPTFEFWLAVERVVAAVEATRASKHGFVLTARAAAHLYGDADIDQTIACLNAFAEAGADVLFAPGLGTLEQVRAVCSSGRLPVNVVIMGDLKNATLVQLAEARVARISVGGSFAYEAYSHFALVAQAVRRGNLGVMEPPAEGLGLMLEALQS